MKLSFFKKKSPEKDFETQLEKLKKAAETSPDDVRIHIKIAEHYMEAKKQKQALEAYLFAAKEYQKRRLPQIAVAIYKNVISIDPDQYDVYLELADLQIKNDFIGDGVALLEKLASHYYQKGMKFEATQVLDRIAKVDPDNAFFKKKIENFYREKNLSADEARAQGPQDKWKLIEEEQKEEDHADVFSQSFFDLEEALGGDDSYSLDKDAEENESETQSESGRALSPDQVFNELQEMIKTSDDKDSPELHYNLGLALYRSNKYDQAMSEFDLALDGVEQKVDCYIKLAGCASGLKDFKKAERYIKKGLSVKKITSDEKLELNFQLGMVYKNVGNVKKALKIFKKIQKEDEKFKSVNSEILKLSSQ